MEQPAVKKNLTPAQALGRLRKYCAYQERSHSEVRTRLLNYGVYGLDLEELMAQLIHEGFLNEERFAIAFAGGKFRMKGWGRRKIESELRKRGISEHCIQTAMKQIPDAGYAESLQKILRKKAATLQAASEAARKKKLAAFLIGKGYEAEMVWQALKMKDES